MQEGLIQHPGSLLMLVLSQSNNIVSLSMFHFAMLMHFLFFLDRNGVSSGLHED